MTRTCTRSKDSGGFHPPFEASPGSGSAGVAGSDRYLRISSRERDIASGDVKSYGALRLGLPLLRPARFGVKTSLSNHSCSS